MKGFPDIPPVWWAASILVIYGIKFLLPDLHFEGAVLQVASWCVLIAALAVIGWSGVWFWRKRTPIEPHHTPKTLIIEGPYRVSRNPIYLALVALTVASALGHGSVLGLAVAAGLWRVLDQRFAAKEEALLVETFGAEANAYIAASRRWI